MLTTVVASCGCGVFDTDKYLDRGASPVAALLTVQQQLNVKLNLGHSRHFPFPHTEWGGGSAGVSSTYIMVCLHRCWHCCSLRPQR